MKSKRSGARDETIRCSISFPTDHYREVERIANEKRVSVAWVVRDALEHYLSLQKAGTRRSK